MEEIILPNIERVSEKDDYGIFVIQPLYPGYGYTIGNSLRRVLLSSLEGAAVSSVKIEGATHQFQTLPGMKEDITELILNLKNLRLKLYEGESATLTLDVKGPKEVLAKDIKTPAHVEIKNPDLYIATLDNKDSRLSMEITVEKGRGYLPVEAKPETGLIGVIQVDSLFSPVKLCNITVENVRVGKRTDFNKLTLEVKTDGTVTPSEAIKQAVEILIQQLKTIGDILSQDKVKKIPPEKNTKKEGLSEVKGEKTAKKKRTTKTSAKKSR